MATSTRGDTLAAPAGAGRIPVIALIAVAIIVVGVIFVGLQGRWFLALLIPIAVGSFYMVAQVASTMVAEIREGRRSMDDQSEE